MRALTLSCAVALTLALSAGVRADENDRLTYMTFSGPVQVPGVTLAAGTYTFKIAEGASSRHVVQIFTKDDNKLITTVMTIPNERLEPVQDTFVMFAERPAGTPVAVKAWFYPGRSIGEEFMYPRRQATQIAKAVHESVLTTDGDETTTTGATARVDESGTVTSNSTTASTSTSTTTTASARPRSTTADRTTTTADRTTTTAPAPAAPARTARAEQSTTTTTAERATTARPRVVQPEAPVATTGQAAPAPVRESLPRTASPMALFELLSGLSLAAGFGVRQLRKRA
jgi:hypothetical protein